jgi:hypothetical protein
MPGAVHVRSFAGRGCAAARALQTPLADATGRLGSMGRCGNKSTVKDKRALEKSSTNPRSGRGMSARRAREWMSVRCRLANDGDGEGEAVGCTW